MTPSQRLMARLRDELDLDIPERAVIRRTYAGGIQRSQGAWKWWLNRGSGYADIGSHFRVTDLLRSPRLVLSIDEAGYGSSYSIDPITTEELVRLRSHAGWLSVARYSPDPTDEANDLVVRPLHRPTRRHFTPAGDESNC